jgi:hypothetical protein
VFGKGVTALPRPPRRNSVCREKMAARVVAHQGKTGTSQTLRAKTRDNRRGTLQRTQQSADHGSGRGWTSGRQQTNRGSREAWSEPCPPGWLRRRLGTQGRGTEGCRSAGVGFRSREPCSAPVPQGPRSERYLGGVVTAPRAWAARRRLLAASTQNGTVAHGGAVSAPGAGDGTGRRLETRLHEPVVAGAAATAS